MYGVRGRNQDNVSYHHLPQSRNYQNGKLWVAHDPSRNQSKGAIAPEKFNPAVRRKLVLGFLEELYPLVADGSKLLVVTFKNIVADFEKECTDPNITFIHWGIHTGTNAYSHYTKAAIIGYNRKNPSSFYQDMHSLHSSFEDYVSLRSSIRNDMSLMQNSGVIVSAIQFFNRICSRVCIDEFGNCAPAQFYIFNDGSMDLAGLLQKAMPGLRVKQWTPVKAPGKRKVDKLLLPGTDCRYSAAIPR